MRRLVALGSAVLVLSATLAASALVWAEPLPSAKPEQVGLASERLDRIGQALRAEIEKGKLPGAIALVARKGRVAYFEAFGSRDKAAGAPMTSSSSSSIRRSPTSPATTRGSAPW